MKPRVQTYVDPADVLGAELNEMQDAMVEGRFGDGCTDGAPATWHPPTTLPTRRIGEVRIILHNYCTTGVETVLDSSVDWRDVYVDRGWVAGEDADNKMPGGTAYAAAATYAKAEVDGYTGKGATGANPPVLVGAGTAGVGEVWRPWGAMVDFWLYVRGTDGALCAWNAVGSDVRMWGVIGLTGDIGGFVP